MEHIQKFGFARVSNSLQQIAVGKLWLEVYSHQLETVLRILHFDQIEQSVQVSQINHGWARRVSDAILQNTVGNRRSQRATGVGAQIPPTSSEVDPRA